MILDSHKAYAWLARFGGRLVLVLRWVGLVVAGSAAGFVGVPAAIAGKGPAFRYIYVGHIGASTLVRPDGVAVDQICGDIYVSDFEAQRIVRFDSGGKFLDTIGHPGTDEGGLGGPVGLFVSPAGLPPANPEGPPIPCGPLSTVTKLVWVADRQADRVSIFSPSGRWEGGLCYWPASIQPAGCSVREGANLDFYPDDVWVTDTSVYVAGGNADRVSEYNRSSGGLERTTVNGPAGSSVAVWGSQLWSVRYDQPLLGLFTLDPANATIELVHNFGSGRFDPSTPGSFASPSAVATAPNGTVYVDDGYRVQVFSPSGRYLSTIRLPGTDSAVPGEGVAVRYDGTVYVSRGAVRRIDVFSPGPLVSLRLKQVPTATLKPASGAVRGSAAAARHLIEMTGRVWPARPHDTIVIQEVARGFSTVAIARLDRRSRFRTFYDAPQGNRTYAFRAFFRDPHPYYADRASVIEQITLR